MGDSSESGQLDWAAFWRVAPRDLDPVETAEWLDALAAVVTEAVASGHLNESKISKLTEIPRMTIRKMLGKA